MFGLCRVSNTLIKFRHTTLSNSKYILTPTTCVRYNSKKKFTTNETRAPAKPLKNVCAAPTFTSCPPIPLSRPKTTVASAPEKTESATPPPPLPPAEDLSNLNKYLLAALLGGAALIGYGYYDGWFDSDKKPAKKTSSKVPAVPLRVPANSKDLPDEVPFLLIGGGTASFSAFRAIKSHIPKAKVLVITDESRMPYMRPPISKEIWFNSSDSIPENGQELKFKQWNGVDRNLFYEPEEFYIDPTKLMESENGGVAVARGYRVKKIDVCERKIILEDGKEIKYGQCLLATGAAPKSLPLFESASTAVKEKLSFYKTIDDYLKLRNNLEKCKAVAVIGGGFLGSELSCALARFGEESKKKFTVYQIFHEKGNMGKILPEYLSSWTTDRVKEEGVCVLSEAQIKSAEIHDHRLKLNLFDGNSIVVDHAIVASGSVPNTDLGVASNLEVDNVLGGYVVNAELEARSNLYVAGDAACFYDSKLGRRRVEHHDHAVISGRLAGENMVGMKKPYTHQSMFWSDLGPRVGYEAIGLIDSNLETTGIFAKITELDTSTPSATSSSSSSPTESTTNTTTEKSASPQPTANDYGRGVIFYLKEGKVVGILLWNLFNRMNVARKIIAQNTHYDDLNEVAKLFDLYDQHQSK